MNTEKNTENLLSKFQGLLNLSNIFSFATGGLLALWAASDFRENLLPVENITSGATMAEIINFEILIFFFCFAILLSAPITIKIFDKYTKVKYVKIKFLGVALLAFLNFITFVSVLTQGEVSSLFIILLWGLLFIIVKMHVFLLGKLFAFTISVVSEELEEGRALEAGMIITFTPLLALFLFLLWSALISAFSEILNWTFRTIILRLFAG